MSLTVTSAARLVLSAAELIKWDAPDKVVRVRFRSRKMCLAMCQARGGPWVIVDPQGEVRADGMGKYSPGEVLSFLWRKLP